MADTAENQTNSHVARVLTPLKAIRAKCIDCCGGSRHEVRLCPVAACALWPYRFGKRSATVAKRAAKTLQEGWFNEQSPRRQREKRLAAQQQRGQKYEAC